MTIAIKSPEISRRSVLAGLGGMTFCLAAGVDGISLISEAQANTGTQVSPWVRIAPDGAITIYSAGAEMGQGSMTSLPLIVAEEMDADWSKVVIEWAPTDTNLYGYGAPNARSMWIVGSRAVMVYYNQLRIAGAQVRKVLIQNAAEKWGVDAATLKTEPSVVINPANGQRLTYAEIAGFGKIPAVLPEVDAKELKAKKDFRLIGKSGQRRDIPAKVNGTAQFAIDVKLPGMVYATTLHSPTHYARPESWNDAEIKKMPGIIATLRLSDGFSKDALSMRTDPSKAAVQPPDGVVIVAERFEQAVAARRALKVVWAKARAAGFNSEQALRTDYAKIHDSPTAQAVNIENKGDVKAAFAGAAKVYKAEFLSDSAYHAQMEPLNAVARYNAADALEVWDGTQGPDFTRRNVSMVTGLKQDSITVHQCYMGGGFGRRTNGEQAAEAAVVAKAVGRPVKLIWTREEDIAQGMMRPQSFQCVEAATDSTGKVTGWRHCVVGDGNVLLQTGIKIPYYDVPNQHIERRGVDHGSRVWYWRAVGHVFNTFAIESLVDQMAVDQKMDPFEFRYQRMSIAERARKCFETVAEMCDWKAPRPEGRALGLSITERSNSWGAGVVEISLDRGSGKIKVHKVWLAVDGGTIVQPDAARANVESGIIHGLSGILHERVTLKDGAVEQSNFHDYHMIKMSDVPEMIEVKFVDRDTPPSGLGEVGLPFVGAAVANAFHKLTGKRLTHMPFTPERVLAVLKA